MLGFRNALSRLLARRHRLPKMARRTRPRLAQVGLEILETRTVLTSFISGDWGWVGAFAAQASDTATDAQGNVYVVGGFSGYDYNQPLDFDPGPDTFSVNATNRDPAFGNAFLAKFDPQGSFQWVRTLAVQYGRVGFRDIEVVADGTLRMVGTAYNQHWYASSSISIYAPATSAETLASLGPGQTDTFTCKFTDNGGFQWLTFLPRGGWLLEDSAVDPTDESLIVGGNSESLFRVSADGVLQTSGLPYSQRIDLDATPGGVSVASISIDANGNTYFGGRLRGGADFDPTATSYDLYSTWQWGWDTYHLRQIRHWSDDIFVAKYSALGELEWVTLQGVAAAHESLENFVLLPNGEVISAISKSSYTNERTISSISPNGAISWAEDLAFDASMYRLVGLTFDSDGTVVLVTQDGLVDIRPENPSPLSWRARIYEGNVRGAHFDPTGRAVVWSAGPVGYGNKWPNTRMEVSGSFPLVSGNANGAASSFPGSYIARLDATAPRIASITRRTPTARVTAASTLTFLVTFTEAVTGVDASDFVVEGSTATVSAVDQQPDGTYAVTVSGGDLATVNGAVSLSLIESSGISDAALNAIATPTPKVGSEVFLLDHKPPTLSIQPVSPSPRNSPVTDVAITFSESVVGVGTAAFRLHRNGIPIGLSDATVTGAANAWTLGNLASLTAETGNYELTLASDESGITDEAGNPPSAGSSIRWTVDATQPTASFAPVSPSLRNTPVNEVAITFSESVVGVSTAAFRLYRNETPVRLSESPVTGTANTWTLGNLGPLTSQSGDYELVLVSDGSGVLDETGNPLIAGSSIRWTVDATQPIALFAPVSPSLRNTALSSVAIAFSEAIQGLDAADFTLKRNGVAVSLGSAAITGVGKSWVLSDLGSATDWGGEYTLVLRADATVTDTVGNKLAEETSVSWTADKIAPQASITPVLQQLRNTPAESIDVYFTEAVTGVTGDAFRLVRDGVTLALSGLSISGQGTQWTLTGLGPWTAAQGAYAITLKGAGSGIKDMAGNALSGVAETTWQTDTTRPTVVLAPVSPALRNTPVALRHLTFSEPVWGLGPEDFLLVRNGIPVSLSQVTVTSDANRWAVRGLAATNSEDGLYSLSLADNATVFDAAGNLVQSSAPISWTVDRTVPTAVFEAVSPTLRNSAVNEVRILFSESVSSVSLTDLVLSRDGASMPLAGARVSGSGRTWTISDLGGLTVAQGAYAITLKGAGSGIKDMAGNALSGVAETTWQTDTTRPTVVLAPVSPALRNTPVALRFLTFSEPVWGLGPADFLLVRNGIPVSLSQAMVTSDANRWALRGLAATNSEDGLYSLSFAENATVFDAAGNLVQAPAPISWTVDRTVPTAVFEAVSPTLRKSAVKEVRILFSESVSSVSLTDLILSRDGANLPLAGARVSGSGRTWTISDLGGLTAFAGTYALAFKPSSGIADAAGNRLGTVQATSWEHLLTVEFGQIPASSKVVAKNIDLVFNAPVTGVTVDALQLTRNGRAVRLMRMSGVSLTGSGSRYVLTLPAYIAQAKGAYVLSLGGPASPVTMGLRTLSQQFSAAWRYL